MSSASPCPGRREWEDLLLGRLQPPQAEQLALHLEQCQRCADALSDVHVEDQMVKSVRDGARSPRVPDPSPAVYTLMDHLQTMWTQRPEGTPARPEAAGPFPQELPVELARVPQLSQNARIGPYRVLGLLGQGGMGMVFEAEDSQLRRRVAIKLMHPDRARDGPGRARFLREARAMAAVKHDHIVTIYHVGEENDVPFLVMELLTGNSLAQRLDQEPRLTGAEFVRIARQIAAGLVAAHAAGLIHRDIKPSNIWLESAIGCRPSAIGPDAEGADSRKPIADGRVKLLDFGLARTADDPCLTQTGVILGTPAYMAPEQARGHPSDARSDLFSLGCVLYHACTGTVPFPGQTTMAQLTALAIDTPRPVRELNPQVPAGLADLIRRLLAKDPAQRPASAQVVVETLAAVEAGTQAATVQVLIADDEADLELLVRQRFRKQIRQREYEFIFARNGIEALERLRERPEISIVLTDINMPDMDGLTLLAKLRESGRILQPAVVSAYGDMTNVRTAMNQGAFDFLTKPIDFQEFERVLTSARDRAHSRRRTAEGQEELAVRRRELAIAAGIQQSMLPRADLLPPACSAVDLCAALLPAPAVGGDFYDFFLVDDHRLGLVLGDVAGQGIPAALLMAIGRTLLKAVALRGSAPGDCLRDVNCGLCRDHPTAMALALFYAVLDLRTGRFSYASAGHPLPHVLGRDGATTLLDGPPGCALGRTDLAAFETRQSRLGKGDTLLLHGRGRSTEPDDQAGDLCSPERLEALLARLARVSSETIVRGFVEGVRKLSAATPLVDDLAVLAVRYLGGP